MNWDIQSNEKKKIDINILHTRWTVELGEIGTLTKWHSMMIICFKGTTAQITLEFCHTKPLEAGRGEIGPLGSSRAELLMRKLCSLFLYPASPLPCPRCKLFAPWSNSSISFRFSQVFPRTFGGFLGNAFFPDFFPVPVATINSLACVPYFAKINWKCFSTLHSWGGDPQSSFPK